MAKRKNTFNKELLALIGFVIISFLLWDTFIIYPIKLFVVFFHEVFHGFVSLTTGGSLSSINVTFDLGGKIETENGNDFLIASAGYLGSLFIGTFLFLYSKKKNFMKLFFYSLIALIIIVMANSAPSNEFIFISVFVIISLLVLSIFIDNFYVSFFVEVIGLISMFYVFIDMRNDLLNSAYESDAKILSTLIGINSFLISLIWMIISAAIIFLSVKKVFFEKT